MLNKSSCHNGIYTALKDANNALRSIACDELGLEGGKKFEKCMMNEMVWPRAVVLMSDSRWEKTRICVERKELREGCEPKKKDGLEMSTKQKRLGWQMRGRRRRIDLKYSCHFRMAPRVGDSASDQGRA
jgi:hypothetical protein